MNNGKLMSDRFREMVKDREEELRGVKDGDEIALLYDILLSQLSVNSKPMITHLTIVAGDQIKHAAGIAHAICARILEVPVEQKLPSLYLLDSIIKNIGREYIKYFSVRLPEVFCDTYRQVHPNMHPAMRRLFGTWSDVFPLSVLRKIESHLQFSASANHQSLGVSPLRASESPRPAHAMHINPKYLEARRQFCHETGDSSFQPPRGASATFKICTQKHPTDCEEFNSDDGDTDVSLVRSNQLASCSSQPGPGAMKIPPTFVGLIERSSCPYGVGYNNGVDVDRTRALIDAYGIDRRPDTLKDLDVEELQVNDIDTEPTMTWKDSEVEEFVWENMSPTLKDDGRKDLFSSSLPPSGNFRNTASLVSHLGKELPNLTKFPSVNGSSIVDAPSSRGGLNSTGYGIHNGPAHIRGSSNLLESWMSTQNVNLSSTHQFNATNGNILWMPSSGRGIFPSVVEQKPSSVIYSSDLNTPNQGPPFVSGGASAGAWPSTHLHDSHARPMLQTCQPNRQIRGQLDTLSLNNLSVNHNVNNSSFSDNNLDSTESILQNHKLPLSGHTTMLHSYSLPQDMRHHVAPPSVLGSSPLLAPQLQRGFAPGHLSPFGTISPNPYTQSPMQNLNAPIASARLLGLPLSLPHGLPGYPNPPVGGSYSNLFSSLMTQGVISLNQTPAKEDPVGLEFNPDLFKVRHESSIRALYSDLPRQCMTCGLRFKLQETHSSHMDWHVTKSRVTRNRKQKPSRKWFVSVNMWLTGAEALGTDSVPSFLPSEVIEDKKDDEELAVPADDDQKFCALCGEPLTIFIPMIQMSGCIRGLST